MANHVNGIGALSSAPSTSLNALRQHLLAALLGNPLFSEAEQLRAKHFVHECEDINRLTRWSANVLAEIRHREATAARLRYQAAARITLRRLRPDRFRGRRPRRPIYSLAWVPGAHLPDQGDRQAGTFDRLAAARFQPVDSLSFADLLTYRPQ